MNTTRTPIRLSALALALTMTLAMLAGIDNLAAADGGITQLAQATQNTTGTAARG